jgi:hypothetical protein
VPLSNASASWKRSSSKSPRSASPLRRISPVADAFRSQDGPNKGREFFGCPKESTGARCRFFKWEDEVEPAARRPTVGRQGSDRFDNGRGSDRFDNGRSNGRAAPRGRAGGGGSGGGGGACFKCGEE